MDLDEQSVAAALGPWGLGGASCRPLTQGHINRTFLVESGRELRVLQRLSPIFGPEVHEDIEAVTAELERAGLATPRLVRTRDGALYARDGEGALWRLLTFVEGETVLSAGSAARCRAAGAFLGRFHRALWGCSYEIRHRRLGVHDTAAHLERLERSLETHRGHREHARVEPLARAILEAGRALELPADQPARLVHGDPKISNFVFGPDGEARALVDLDTLARMPLCLELGDALRSWCAPLGEEQEQEVEVAHFRAALEGYAAGAGALPTAAEREAIAPTVEVIAVELAARFCADALHESYFGWDRSRFPSASAHHQVRARAQLALGRSVRSRLDELREIVRQAWRAPAASC